MTLVVTGRAPEAGNLALEKAGIAFSSRGIAVDRSLKTSSDTVYAAGDVTGNCFLAYSAQAEGIIAAENALGGKATFDYSAIPRVVFCQTVAASVGARQADTTMKAGRFPLTANSRAFIEGERTGWVKLLSDRSSGKLLGGTVFGPGAEDTIAVIALAVRKGLHVSELRRELFFHPSLSEAVYGAGEDIDGICVDLPPKALPRSSAT